MLEVLRFWFTKDLVYVTAEALAGKNMLKPLNRNTSKANHANHTIQPWVNSSGYVEDYCRLPVVASR